MTDEEIEKGLEHCGNGEALANCDKCPYYEKGNCIDLFKDALDYINRLKVNLERAIQSFTKMETLYKVKCKELEVAEEWKRRQQICNETNTERIMQLEDEKDQIRKDTAKEIIKNIDDRLKALIKLGCGIDEINCKYIKRSLCKEYGVKVDE